jgi:hypothetical protein
MHIGRGNALPTSAPGRKGRGATRRKRKRRPLARPAFSCSRSKETGDVLGRPGSDLLSQALRLSTIGATGFNGRVRDGIGFWAPRNYHQIGEKHRLREFWSRLPEGRGFSELSQSFRRCPHGHGLMRTIKPIELLVPVSFTRCRASTSGLSTWWSSTALKGMLVLREASCLDAFSSYPVRI